MHRGVDPPTALGQEDGPVVGGNCPGVSSEDVLCLVLGMVFQKTGCKVSIFSQVQQVLHVQRVHTDLRVCVDYILADKQRLSSFCGADAIHTETSRKTGDGAKERLESLGQIMGDVVLVYLDHGDHRALCVTQSSFAAHSNQAGVVQEGCNHSSGRVWSDHCICINLQYKLIESWIDTDDVPNLMVHLELHGCHGKVVVNAVEEAHENHLRVTFATITRPVNG